jgi:hypothetical protein
MDIKRGRPVTLSTSGQERISLGKINRDGGTQPRSGLDDEHVKRLVDALDDGQELPAITLYYDGTTYWLADGFHRFAAHEHKQLPTINADVRQGDRRAAVLHSVGANRGHGLPRSRGDVQRAIETLLRDDEWGKWSDREIARQVGCSHVTVGSARERLALSGQIDQIDNRTVARNGTTFTQAPKSVAAAPPAPAQAAKPAPWACVACGGDDRGFHRYGQLCAGCYHLTCAKDLTTPLNDDKRFWHLDLAKQIHRDNPKQLALIADVADMLGRPLPTNAPAQAAKPAPPTPRLCKDCGGDGHWQTMYTLDKRTLCTGCYHLERATDTALDMPTRHFHLKESTASIVTTPRAIRLTRT